MTRLVWFTIPFSFFIRYHSMPIRSVELRSVLTIFRVFFLVCDRLTSFPHYKRGKTNEDDQVAIELGDCSPGFEPQDLGDYVCKHHLFSFLLSFNLPVCLQQPVFVRTHLSYHVLINNNVRKAPCTAIKIHEARLVC